MAPLPKSQGYDIEPAGVSRVLKSLQSPVEELQAAGKDIETNLPEAAHQSQSTLVVKALTAFMDYHARPLKEVGHLVQAAPKGAVDATRAYLDGDREMFDRAQRYPRQSGLRALQVADSRERVERALR
jgi:Family of unknown function (DUF6507)